MLGAKAVVVTGVVLTVGLATSAACFQLVSGSCEGGFNYEGGYLAVALADGLALRGGP